MIKGAGVKNNQFSVICSEQAIVKAEDSKKQARIGELETNVRDPKQSYAHQPESEPGNVRQNSQVSMNAPKLIQSE